MTRSVERMLIARELRRWHALKGAIIFQQAAELIESMGAQSAPPSSNLESLRSALSEWDQLKAPFGSIDRPTRFDMVLNDRAQALEKIIVAAREVATAVETSEESDPCVSHLAMKEYEREIAAILDGLGARAVRVREGDGMENLLQSLAVTVAKLARSPEKTSAQQHAAPLPSNLVSEWRQLANRIIKGTDDSDTLGELLGAGNALAKAVEHFVPETSGEWEKEARLTLDKLAALLQCKNVPYAVNWRDWIDNAIRVLDAYSPEKTSAQQHAAPLPSKDESPRPSDERNGCYLDDAGCCKVCDGELPYGHIDACDIWKLEDELRKLKAAQGETPVAIAGDCLPTTLAQFELRASRLLSDEQAKPNPDNALVAFLCDAVRLARENERLATSPLKTSA